MSTIIDLVNTDNGADSLSIINTNLGNLNTDKLEASDITGKEDVSNKKTSLADNSDTFYPTQKAVKTAVDAKQDTLAFTPEDSANKENTTINTSTTKYPTVNLLKTGLDSKLALVGGTMTGGVVLAAGTTTLQPLKMVAGTNLTTPVAGVFEFDGTNLYFSV